MFKIKLADSVILVDNHYCFVENQCRDFITDEEPSIYISLSIKTIEKEKGNKEYSLEYCESLATYREICKRLIFYNIFLFHGAFFSYKQNGILFVGPSGSGKTTQMRKWQAEKSDDVKIVNGDKPLFHYKERKLVGYGTPWSGKENLYLNTSTELKAIFFIIKSNESVIEELSQKEALPVILNQLFFPNYEKSNLILLELVKEFINEIPIFKFYGTLDKNSVKEELAYLKKILGE